MLRLSTDTLSLNGRVISTATEPALAELARLCRAQDYPAIHAFLSHLDPQLAFFTGSLPQIDVNFTRQPPIYLTLPPDIVTALAVHIQQLVTDNDEVHISEIFPALHHHSKFDWTLRKRTWRAEPEHDYERHPAGALWEAVLFHDRPTIAAGLRAWEYLRTWSVQADTHEPNVLSVQFTAPDREPEDHEPQAAFARVYGHGDAYQVIDWCAVPFRRSYGEAHDWIQVWFEEDRTMLIVHDRHAETGSHRWDIENFFLYQQVLVQMAYALQAETFVWGIMADSYADDQRQPMSKLTDVDALWYCFKAATERDPSDTYPQFEALAPTLLTRMTEQNE